LAALLALALPAAAQQAAPAIVFATAAQARAILSQRDDYVRATGDLERRVRLSSAEAVSDEEFVRRRAALARDWSDQERRLFTPAVERLGRFIEPFRVNWPAQLLLARADPALEDGASFTRANAAFLSDGSLSNAGAVHYFLAHEAFHVLSRSDPALRERLYAALGFVRCAHAEIPERVARLRVTNPDAVESLHSIRVRFRGEALEALPYIRLRSDDIDPRAGMFSQMTVRWLLVDRVDSDCRVRETPAGVPDADPAELQGLPEQIGRNSSYLLHPDEILADNFAQMFIGFVQGSGLPVPSPQIHEKIRALLTEP
jgi:hypothetical protein